jgi:hypothetical protein
LSDIQLKDTEHDAQITQRTQAARIFKQLDYPDDTCTTVQGYIELQGIHTRFLNDSN